MTCEINGIPDIIIRTNPSVFPMLKKDNCLQTAWFTICSLMFLWTNYRINNLEIQITLLKFLSDAYFLKGCIDKEVSQLFGSVLLTFTSVVSSPLWSLFPFQWSAKLIMQFHPKSCHLTLGFYGMVLRIHEVPSLTLGLAVEFYEYKFFFTVIFLWLI